jgi:hypothetical protein
VTEIRACLIISFAIGALAMSAQAAMAAMIMFAP